MHQGERRSDTPTDWRASAACRADDAPPPDVFFPRLYRGVKDRTLALACCARCSVRFECLEAALSVETISGHNEACGIFGGLDADARKRILRTRRDDPMPAHGTERRYWRGCSCADCRAAHTEAELGRSAARRQPEIGYLTAAVAAPKHRGWGR